MQAPALGQSRAHHAARTRRLLEKLALALAGAALLCIFLFILVHLNEAVNTMRTDSAGGDVYFPKCAAANGIPCEPSRNRGANN